MAELLPHLIGAINATITALIVWAFFAIGRRNRTLHARLMKSAIAIGAVFLVVYALQVATIGHRRFPGEDWVRTLFLAILITHTILAMLVVPMILRAFYLAMNERFVEHRRVARVAFPAWLYVGITGVLIYWMNQYLRPGG